MPHISGCLRAVVGVSWLLGASAVATAQVANPQIAEFYPSPAHHDMLDAYTPAVTNYVLEVYQAGAAAPFYSMDMGKPRVDPDGRVRYHFQWGGSAWPLPGGAYVARVAAQGPYGSGLSGVSNVFTVIPDESTVCTLRLSPANLVLPAIGGPALVDISVGWGCPWTVSLPEPWIALPASGGSGSAALWLILQQNRQDTPRFSRVTLGSTVLTITQKAALPPRVPRNLRAVSSPM